MNGKFIIEEIYAESHYISNDNKKIVDLKYGTTTNVEFENHRYATLKVVKKCNEDNIIVAGVKFNLLDSKNNVIGTYVTNTNGIINITKLNANNVYYLQEVSTLDKYILNGEKIEIKVKWGENKEITVDNKIKYASLKIIKVCSEDNITIAGVKFNLLDNKDNVIGTYITDINGEFKVEKLREDREYYLQEVSTLDKYILNGEKIEIKVKWGENKEITVDNKIKYASLKVIKVCEENNQKIAGVKFNLLDNKNNVIGTYITDINGEFKVEKLREDREYYLQEIETLDIYVLNNEKIEIKIKWGESKEITINNELVKGKIEVYKQSSNYNKYDNIKENSYLQNCKIGIYDMNNNLIQILVTDKNGYAISGLLLKGKYVVKELVPPKHYLLGVNNIGYVEIIYNNEIVITNFKNKTVDIKVDVDKIGYIETQPNDVIRYSFSNIKNCSNIKLDVFQWVDYLPYDYIRLQNIITGTWNEDINYKMLYKTNLKDKYSIYDNLLNTQINYNIDIKDLQLNENEFITEFMFEFENVKMEFQEVIQPEIYCKALSHLKHKEEFINNTSTIGYYDDLKYVAKDKWLTIIYIKDIFVKNLKLPKTGK